MSNFKSSSKEIKGLTSSKIAKKENNDCFVRALAAATGSTYDAAHEVVETKFNRSYKKGTKNYMIRKVFKEASSDGLKVGDTKYDINVLTGSDINNTYKLYGEYIDRKKTVKSFIQDHPKGNYVVTVSKHAFAVNDGMLVDNVGEEFRPTRKVDGAYKIISPIQSSQQLTLF